MKDSTRRLIDALRTARRRRGEERDTFAASLRYYRRAADYVTFDGVAVWQRKGYLLVHWPDRLGETFADRSAVARALVRHYASARS